MNFEEALKVVSLGGTVKYIKDKKSFFLGGDFDLLETLDFYLDTEFLELNPLTFVELATMKEATFLGHHVFMQDYGNLWKYTCDSSIVAGDVADSEFLNIKNWDRRSS